VPRGAGGRPVLGLRVSMPRRLHPARLRPVDGCASRIPSIP
jgi:hypothetical protein